MANILVTKKSREKLAKARAGIITTLPSITGIALGNGGTNESGDPRDLTIDNTVLFNELIRRPYDSKEAVSDTCYKYIISLGATELEGKNINEMGLYDSEGDFVALVTFSNKKKDGYMEMDFEMEDKF